MPPKGRSRLEGQIREEIEMKGLEALERLMSKYNEMCLDTGCNDDEYQNGNTTSERAIIEKELKALEIIKRTALKLVSLEDETTICPKGGYAFYDGELYQYEELTKDEFDLLKEVLG